jgi:RimJ/RimL family protein N-acetyltransferase
MIGTEPVSVIPDDGSYNGIQAEIDSAPDRDLWYGPTAAMKAARHRAGSNWSAAALPFLFAGVAIALFVDAFGDTDSAWNPWNVTFFVAMMVVLFVATIISAFAIVPPDRIWTRHKLIVRLGDRVNIGTGDIWEDKANKVAILDCSLLPQYRGQRLGSVATRMMIRKCFTELDVNRIESSALSTNPRAMKMNDRMVEEGVLRQRYLIRNQYVDEHLYRLLKAEWLTQLAQRTMPLNAPQQNSDSQSGAGPHES